MLKNMKTDSVGWIILLGVIILLLEISFQDEGLFLFLAILVGCIYFGKKRLHRTIGKLLFWFGVIMLTFSLLSTMAFKFFLFAILIYVLVRFSKLKQHPKKIEPEIIDPAQGRRTEPYIRKEPLFQNQLFGRQSTSNSVYEWQDINIQCGIGDTIIDLSNTVLPKGEVVIVVRNLIGNVQVKIPYEVELSVHHSVLFGSSKIFGEEDAKVFNQSILYKTPGFDDAPQRVKIVTSLIIGDLEVAQI
ncbi:cell wall-active antibiotics response protein LiaF [Metabacillus arenae]|uniref:Cell wall-active antibiotics response protein n=1 Tax=Metabacillus arenae TaxID=2771434 RepID=A0A926NGF7_9BACI|nr:cell wall-active antibiotics response protein LiaF [Metabacillus arenae]MBD1379568.1 cell wall-active antibiotics response protein [Metabacillus arenae]